MELLRRETPEFTAPDMWLPTCPDLNAVDYRILKRVGTSLYQTPTQDVAELRQRLMSTWAGFQRSAVDELIDQ